MSCACQKCDGILFKPSIIAEFDPESYIPFSKDAWPKLSNANHIVWNGAPAVMENEHVSDVDQAFLDYEAAHPIIIASGRANPDAMTQTILRDLKGREADEYGAIRSGEPGSFEVRFHPSSKDRVIAIIDALAKACRDRGFTFEDGTPGARSRRQAAIVIDGMEVRPVLEERMRRVPYKMTAEEVAQRRRGRSIYTPTYSYEPTGELTLKLEIARSTGLQTIWKDSRKKKVETRLNDVMVGLRALANRYLADRDKAEDRKRRYDLLQEQRAELRQQIALERKAVEVLEFDAKAWSRARDMRAYIAAAEQQYTEQGGLHARRGWISWARDQADRMDPLATSPSSILDMPERDYKAFEIWQMRDED